MVFRRYFLKKFEKPVLPEEENEMIGRQAVALDDIQPGIKGRVLVRDTHWQAKSDVPIAKGETVIIINSENITLFVKPFVGK